MRTHPYVDGGARSRADRARRIGVALFKVVGRSPRPRQPGATGSNAYCLVWRCTTGSKSLVPLPCWSCLSRARLPNGACTATRTTLRPRRGKLLEHFDIYCPAAAAWHFRRNDGVPANKILQTASSERNVELLGTGSLRDSRPGFTACEVLRNVAFSSSLRIVMRLDKASLCLTE